MIQILPISETNVMIYLGDQIDVSLTQVISAWVEQLHQLAHPAIIEVIPSYTSILIQYQPRMISFAELTGILRDLDAHLDDIKLSGSQQSETKHIILPVYYGVDVGPDLLPLARSKGLTVEQVIKLHSQKTYTVSAIGFAPGFAFLAAVDEAIAMPRHREPRALIPAGSVGIANQQTAVYPSASPGGWQIIGNCPLALFSPDMMPMTPFSVGDTVTFTPISQAQFVQQGGELCPSWK
ncbi:5-oxoprolinase subunit PxpB [Photobacterium nomapromontoriensis]|uniref:5-oxoprolinase subunit PxpB n=1 Tax=Photobacterium nomapromontoriensis TaxID=2910237 RepID=UPI003D107749